MHQATIHPDGISIPSSLNTCYCAAFYRIRKQKSNILLQKIHFIDIFHGPGIGRPKHGILRPIRLSRTCPAPYAEANPYRQDKEGDKMNRHQRTLTILGALALGGLGTGTATAQPAVDYSDPDN